MSDLRSALMKVGLVSERTANEAEAANSLSVEEEIAGYKRSVKERERRLQILRQSTAPDLFRREARKLLLDDPSLVQEILNIAHDRGMHKKKERGGGRLIANLYQLREALSRYSLTSDERKSIVDSTFPKK